MNRSRYDYPWQSRSHHHLAYEDSNNHIASVIVMGILWHEPMKKKNLRFDWGSRNTTYLLRDWHAPNKKNPTQGTGTNVAKRSKRWLKHAPKSLSFPVIRKRGFREYLSLHFPGALSVADSLAQLQPTDIYKMFFLWGGDIVDSRQLNRHSAQHLPHPLLLRCRGWNFQGMWSGGLPLPSCFA